MFRKADITPMSTILEIGCGNGVVAIWLAQQTGCRVVGIDISNVRIQNAKAAASAYPDLNVEFICGTITDLPFEDGQFTHVWGQTVFYHVPALETALREVSRVLTNRGILIFDEFVRPTIPIQETLQKRFYERLKFTPQYTHEAYLSVLRHLRLMPIETIDMARHIARTYALAANNAASIDPEISQSFRVTSDATETGEIVGYFYKCVKVTDPAQWAYECQSSTDVKTRYDTWAELYDQDLTSHYDTPSRAAQQFSQYVDDKTVTILDVGCGTGLMGQALAKLGYTTIEGLDLSKGMLKVAGQKQCYSHLFEFNLIQDNLLNDPDIEKYTAIISAGCITFGHAPAHVLARIFAWLKPGGIFHITVRQDFMEQNVYFKTLLHGLHWQILSQESWTIFADEELMLGLVLRKDDTEG
jgi:ubiquinone/menaquinone biosynthesis C-methylase UbiE